MGAYCWSNSCCSHFIGCEMKVFFIEDRPAFVRNIEIENDILELDGFVVKITDSNSCNINLKKGGEGFMNKTKLEELIEAYKKDLAEAVAARDTIATENVEAKVEAKLAEKKQEISDAVYAQHNASLADANKTIELINIIIARKENALAEHLANEQDEIEETIEEGV